MTFSTQPTLALSCTIFGVSLFLRIFFCDFGTLPDSFLHAINLQVTIRIADWICHQFAITKPHQLLTTILDKARVDLALVDPVLQVNACNNLYHRVRVNHFAHGPNLQTT